ncbi:MAG: response regulator [Chromatiales bacterium]|jgi:two-component system chemotaxis response regulator CheY
MGTLSLADIVVMLVEPSATQQKIITQQLNSIGVSQVLLHGSGEEALADMPEAMPDAVVSALYLPDMSGTDLVHRMRENEVTHDIAFILISSETRFRYLDPIRQAGAIAILPKPFSIDELRVAMNNTLDLIEPEALQQGEISAEELNVLIVDDSGMARKHIRRVLNSFGVENFTEAQDGVEALQLLSDHYYDLVVTDYNMPNMDGSELVDQIRNHSSQASIPVIMVTSEESENRLAAVQQAGVSAICDKPFSPDTVRSLIQQLLM